MQCDKLHTLVPGFVITGAKGVEIFTNQFARTGYGDLQAGRYWAVLVTGLNRIAGRHIRDENYGSTSVLQPAVTSEDYAAAHGRVSHAIDEHASKGAGRGTQPISLQRDV